jgi:hypothetical protein
MTLQTLTLKLDGITAGDYLTWCRDPEPAALDFALRSISIDAEPLGDTITAILDWNHSPPPVAVAAGAAGLPLSTGVNIDEMQKNRSHPRPPACGTSPRLKRAAPADVRGAGTDAESRLPRRTSAENQVRTAAPSPGHRACASPSRR